MSLYLIKNIYKPDKKVLTADQEMLLNRRFQKGYEKKKDDPQVKELLEEINKYRSRLKNVGIEDYQVIN